MDRVAIIIDVMPSYRKNFYKRILGKDDMEVRVFCQEVLPGHNLKLVHAEFPGYVRLIKFLSFGGDRLVLQWLPFVHLLKNHNVFLVYGNPRFPASLLFAFIARLFRKKVIIWAQYHTADANPRTEKIRHFLISRFDNLFLYNDAEAAQMTEWNKKSRCVIGMNNGLDQDVIEATKASLTPADLKQFAIDKKIDGRLVVLSCARLLKKNNFDFFIRCLPVLRQQHPNLVWCLIGDGPEKDALVNLAEELDVADAIIWVGAVYEEDSLAKWFLNSEIFVHPSGVGLSLNHAFGYGVPVITHDDYHAHMPEIYAIEDGVNGLLYEKDSIDSFVEKFSSVNSDSGVRQRMADNALLSARQKFNTKVMSERFREVVACAKKG